MNATSIEIRISIFDILLENSIEPNWTEFYYYKLQQW